MIAVWANQLLQGVMLGGLYTLFAIGLSLSAGVMRFVNIAHGDFIVLTCYALLLLSTLLGVNPVVATLIVLPIAFLFGFVLQRFLLQRVVGENVLLVILVTFALSIIIENGLLERLIDANQHVGATARDRSVRLRRRAPRVRLYRFRHRVFKIEDDRVGVAQVRLLDELRHVGGDEEQRTPDELARALGSARVPLSGVGNSAPSGVESAQTGLPAYCSSADQYCAVIARRCFVKAPRSSQRERARLFTHSFLIQV